MGLEVLTYEEWKERHAVEQEVAAAEAAAKAATIAAAVAGGGKPVVVGEYHVRGGRGEGVLLCQHVNALLSFSFLIICRDDIPSLSPLVFSFFFFLFSQPLQRTFSMCVIVIRHYSDQRWTVG